MDGMDVGAVFVNLTLFAARYYASTAYAVMRCVYVRVCLSV